MEMLNKIEVIGIVGRSETAEYGGKRVVNFSVVTDYTSPQRDGTALVETQWFNCSIWENVNNAAEIAKLNRGVWAHVIGRLRTRKYTTQNGEERQSVDIVVRTLEVTEPAGDSI